MEVVKYREQFGMHPPTIYHECLVCHDPCTHTYPGLTQHLTAHSLSLAEYYQKYITNNFNPLRGNVQNVVMAPNMKMAPLKIKSEVLDAPKTTIMQQITKLKPLMPLPQPSPSLDEFSAWKDVCLYSCKICNYSTKMRRFMVEHIKSKHSMSSSNYIQQFGTLESKAKYHSCKICQSPILQDSVTLQTHLYHSHSKMTVKDYYDKFINKTMSSSVTFFFIFTSKIMLGKPQIKRFLF